MHTLFSAKHTKKSAIARPMRRWDGNFKIDVEQYDGRVFIWLKIRTSKCLS